MLLYSVSVLMIGAFALTRGFPERTARCIVWHDAKHTAQLIHMNCHALTLPLACM